LAKTDIGRKHTCPHKTR